MKLPFRLCASLVALMLVCSCGCFDLDIDFATFVNPTVEPEKAKTQKALYGSYIVSEVPEQKEEDGDLASPVSSATTMFHFGKAGNGFPNGFLRAASVEIKSDGGMHVDDSGWVVFATKVDDCYVLNIPNPKENEEEIFEDLDSVLNEDLDLVEQPSEKVVQWKPENYDGYMLLVLKPTQAGFAMHDFDADKLKAEMKAGRLSGDYMTKEEKDEYRKRQKLAEKEGRKTEATQRPFKVKASPRELRAFLEKHLDNVIEPQPIMLFRRVK